MKFTKNTNDLIKSKQQTIIKQKTQQIIIK